MEKYSRLQTKGIAIWKKYISFNFDKEIKAQKFTLSLYSSITDNKNYYGLGHFNYIIDLCSNIFIPSSNLSLSKPKIDTYIEYMFTKNKLVLVKHISNKGNNLYFYIKNDFVFQLTSCYELSSIFFVSKGNQMQISQAGIYVDCIKKIEPNLYQRIFCDLFSYTVSLYEYVNSLFVEKKICAKIIKKSEDIFNLNNTINPYPFDLKFISNGIEMLKKGGYHEN